MIREADHVLYEKVKSADIHGYCMNNSIPQSILVVAWWKADVMPQQHSC